MCSQRRMSERTASPTVNLSSRTRGCSIGGSEGIFSVHRRRIWHENQTCGRNHYEYFFHLNTPFPTDCSFAALAHKAKYPRALNAILISQSERYYSFITLKLTCAFRARPARRKIKPIKVSKLRPPISKSLLGEPIPSFPVDFEQATPQFIVNQRTPG